MPEYMYRPMMQGLSALRPVDFEGVATPVVPDQDTIYRTAPELLAKAQQAKRALAEVAIAIGSANEDIIAAGLAAEDSNPTKIPGIDDKVLEYLDGIERSSSPHTSEYEQKAIEDSEAILDWFDLVDDGSPLLLTTKKYNETPTGQPLYNKEHRQVKHTTLQRVGDVYGLSQFTWETHDWRAIPKANSQSMQFYFTRDEDGALSPVIWTRSEDTENLSSPLVTERTRFRPSTWSHLGHFLKEFRRGYIVQQQMATTLDLLGSLPKVYGSLSRQGQSSRTLAHERIQTDYRIQTPVGMLEVAGYGERGAVDSQGRHVFSGIGISDARSYSGFFVDCDEWRIRRPPGPSEHGVNEVLQSANVGLRSLLMSASESA